MKTFTKTTKTNRFRKIVVCQIVGLQKIRKKKVSELFFENYHKYNHHVFIIISIFFTFFLHFLFISVNEAPSHQNDSQNQINNNPIQSLPVPVSTLNNNLPFSAPSILPSTEKSKKLIKFQEKNTFETYQFETIQDRYLIDFSVIMPNFSNQSMMDTAAALVKNSLGPCVNFNFTLSSGFGKMVTYDLG